MPVYEYYCRGCDGIFEARRSMREHRRADSRGANEKPDVMVPGAEKPAVLP